MSEINELKQFREHIELYDMLTKQITERVSSQVLPPLRKAEKMCEELLKQNAEQEKEFKKLLLSFDDTELNATHKKGKTTNMLYEILLYFSIGIMVAVFLYLGRKQILRYNG